MKNFILITALVTAVAIKDAPASVAPASSSAPPATGLEISSLKPTPKHVRERRKRGSEYKFRNKKRSAKLGQLSTPHEKRYRKKIKHRDFY